MVLVQCRDAQATGRKRSHLAIIIWLLLMAISFACGPDWVFAVADQAPISIEADQMESVRKDDAVLFTGNVEARQGDLAIHADEMTVYYQKTSGGEVAVVADRESIRKFVARGHVKIVRLDWVATGDEVQYLSEERQVILSGNTKVRQEGNIISGDRVILFLDEGRSVMEGSADGGRVKGIFYPSREK